MFLRAAWKRYLTPAFLSMVAVFAAYQAEYDFYVLRNFSELPTSLDFPLR
jgi:hypothetical protein